MENWYLLEHGRNSPYWNMACDEWLLKNASRLGQPTLRIYAWNRPAITIGYFQPFPTNRFLHATIVRRPTGGALVIHDSDLTFTVVLPPDHPWRKLKTFERYHCIHERVARIFELKGLTPTLVLPEAKPSLGRALETDLCFIKSSSYDVLVHGIKVAGGAQRTTREGLLHQGSIQGGGSWRVSFDELQHSWQTWGVHFINLKLAITEIKEITTLATQKYATPSWNHRFCSSF